MTRASDASSAARQRTSNGRRRPLRTPTSNLLTATPPCDTGPLATAPAGQEQARADPRACPARKGSAPAAGYRTPPGTSRLYRPQQVRPGRLNVQATSLITPALMTVTVPEAARCAARLRAVRRSCVPATQQSDPPIQGHRTARAFRACRRCQNGSGLRRRSHAIGQAASSPNRYLSRPKIGFGWRPVVLRVSGGVRVLVDQAAQDGFSADPFGAGVGCGDEGSMAFAVGDTLRDALVRPSALGTRPGRRADAPHATGKNPFPTPAGCSHSGLDASFRPGALKTSVR
jgi:hypothetical protein